MSRRAVAVTCTTAVSALLRATVSVGSAMGVAPAPPSGDRSRGYPMMAMGSRSDAETVRASRRPARAAFDPDRSIADVASGATPPVPLKHLRASEKMTPCRGAGAVLAHQDVLVVTMCRSNRRERGAAEPRLRDSTSTIATASGSCARWRGSRRSPRRSAALAPPASLS